MAQTHFASNAANLYFVRSYVLLEQEAFLKGSTCPGIPMLPEQFDRNRGLLNAKRHPGSGPPQAAAP